MSEWTRIPHDGDYDNLDSTLIIPITQKKVHTQNLPRIIQGEENADILTFETDRFYNGVDLTATVISIIYKNANGTFYERAVNVEYSDDKLRFSWAVSKNATACKGILVINLEFDGLDEHKEVITVKSVRFPIEIEPAVLGKDISDYKSDNWVEETNARVKNLENECKELSGDITDLDEKLSQKADSNTVASVSQLGMIKLLASASGQNQSGLVVDKDTGVAYINARSDRGIYRDGAGQLQINPAREEDVEAGVEQYKPITPKTLKIVTDDVKTAIADKQEKTNIVYNNRGTATLENNTEIRQVPKTGTTLTISIDGGVSFSYDTEFISSVIFQTDTSSVGTVNILTDFVDNDGQLIEVIYKGEDITVSNDEYVFTPVANKRYCFMYWWDGEYMVCEVTAYELP